jgi:TonB family protein
MNYFQKRQITTALVTAAAVNAFACLAAHAEEHATYDFLPIKKMLVEAEHDGVGVASYEKALAAIEESAKTGASKDEIDKQLERLKYGLNEQLQRNRPRYRTPSVAVARYFGPIENTIPAKLGKFKGLDGKLDYKLHIAGNGTVDNVIDDNLAGCPETPAVRAAVTAKLRKLQFPKPPQPLMACISVSNSPELCAFGYGDDLGWSSFMEAVQKRIRRHWQPPFGEETAHIVVEYDIARDGVLKRLRLIQSGGHAEADAAALKAVQESAPFFALPDCAPKFVSIRFTFDYNVYRSKAADKTASP